MKKRIIQISISLISIFIIISIYNYLDVHIFRKSLVQNYIDDSYLRPNFVAEFEQIRKEKEEKESADSMEYISVEEIITKNSVWMVGQRDLSLLREEWHFLMFDYLKRKKPNEAEQIFKKYLEIKNEEILSLQKLEENFTKVNNALLKKSKNVKDGKYYRKFQTQLKAKTQFIEETQKVMQNRKLELFGEEMFEDLTTQSKSYIDKVSYRLIHEYNFTEVEVEDIDKGHLANKLFLMP